MKKLCTIIGLLAMFSFSAQAQSTVRVDGGGGGLAYDKGDKIIQLGLGLGRAVGGGWAYGGGLGISFNGAFEYGLHEYFSVGPYAAFGRYSYGFAFEDYSLTAVAVGARGSFHYTSLLNEIADTNIDEEKLDLYVSVLLGLEFFSTNIDNDLLNYNTTRFDGGALFGGRYKLNPRVAVFSELGYAGLSVWTIGVSFHL
ncbi:hypothetical protein [Tunicatimonas pelagia]|uniref:hypothetical protein n=1 Tax=Tunicatimonas pelagia TaxID=931531 RepID=UPI002665B4CD|nr:hypothetical protein [Tunicatimonas pelagia]WKN44408.1 hypothetical protein P0M28_05450 [Tunicatimonas pelagia]